LNTNRSIEKSDFDLLLETSDKNSRIYVKYYYVFVRIIMFVKNHADEIRELVKEFGKEELK